MTDIDASCGRPESVRHCHGEDHGYCCTPGVYVPQPDGVAIHRSDLTPKQVRALAQKIRHAGDYYDEHEDLHALVAIAAELAGRVERLTAELDELHERLAVAETVCTLTGWSAADRVTEIGKARLQAWMDWSNTYGSPAPTPEWDQRIADLAKRREKTHAAAIAKLHTLVQEEPRG